MKTLSLAGLAIVLTACSGSGEKQVDTTATAVPAVAPAPALDDATIVAIFDAANTADIETGELAVQRGSTKAVRDFGAMLARDHKSVRQQGRDLAARLGVTPTPPADNKSAQDHEAAMTALREKSGKDFDRAFLDHEVAFHQAVLDAVNSTLMPAIQNAELKDLVTKVAPAFEAHRAAAADMRQKMGN